MARLFRSYGLIAILLFVITCGGIDTFDVTEESTSTIGGATLLEQLVGDIGFGGFLNMDISQNEELKNQGVKKNQIDSVFLTSLNLVITDPPSDQDFTFLESIKFYVESDGLEKKLIASGGPFEAGLTTIGLGVQDVDLAPYAAAPSMNVTTEVTGRRPNQDTTVKATMVLNVDVDVSGAICGGD